MPIPGSVLNNLLPFGLSGALGMYPSLATLRPLTAGDGSSGEREYTYTDSVVAGQLNLPCRISPLIQVRPQDQEKVSISTDRRSEANFQVNIAAHVGVLPEILIQWQVKVDGIVYQIRAAESDGSGLTTRLMVALIPNYNSSGA